MQRDGKECKDGDEMVQTIVSGGDDLDDGKATCFGTKEYFLDTCLGRRKDSCSWVFPTPPCPPTPRPTPAPTPAPTPDDGPSCPADDRETRGSLNTCEEQEKCFSLSYNKVKGDNDCEEPNCDFKWEVCIDINNDNPCCAKKGRKAFKNACIRGAYDDDTCLDDGDSIADIFPIGKVRFGKTYCEYVRPGDDAIFQLVSFV